jgi:phosphoglycolate phosphatase
MLSRGVCRRASVSVLSAMAAARPPAGAGPAPAAGSPAAAALSALGDGSAVRRVVFFDIDGTLTSARGPAANRVHKDSVGAAAEAVFGARAAGASLATVPHAGRTDQWILTQVLAERGVAADEAAAAMPALMDAMVAYVAARAPSVGDGVAVLPGVAATLAALAARRDTAVGLVTGNLEAIAWIKMAAVGLDGYFCVGGFGSDAVDRADLIRTGLARASAALPAMPRLPPAARVFHVGDTPLDVDAAARAGVRCVAVATGAFSVEELRDAAAAAHAGAVAAAAAAGGGAPPPAVVLPDLTDAAAVAAALGLDEDGDSGGVA